MTPSSCQGVVEQAGIVALPGDVDLEDGLDVAGQGLGVVGEAHGLADVVENGSGAGVEDSDQGPRRGCCFGFVGHASQSFLRLSTVRTSRAMSAAVRPYFSKS